MAVMTYREALNLALREEMRRDDRVFVIGLWARICAAHNARLRRYYAEAGYSEVGHQPHRLGSSYPVTLFEKRLSGG